MAQTRQVAPTRVACAPLGYEGEIACVRPNVEASNTVLNGLTIAIGMKRPALASRMYHNIFNKRIGICSAWKIGQ